MENNIENGLENKPEKLSIKTISLKDLWNVLRGCIIFVILAAIATTGIMYYQAKSNYVPMYSSAATVYLIGEYDGEFNIEEFASDYNVAYRVINECSYLLQSRRIKDAVRKDLLETTGDDSLGGGVTIDVPEEMRIINISATATSPERAKAIVDSYCKCGAAEMKEWLAYDQFRVFDKASINTWPVNAISLMSYAKYGIIAGGLIYVIFLAMFLFDNYIRTEEDIEHYLGLSILGDIPDAFASNKRKKRYSNYKGYKSSNYGNLEDKGGKE